MQEPSETMCLVPGPISQVGKLRLCVCLVLGHRVAEVGSLVSEDYVGLERRTAQEEP